MKARIKCLESKYGLWEISKENDIILTWDSVSRYFYTIDNENKVKHVRFYIPGESNCYENKHVYKVGDIIEGVEGKFLILGLL